MGVVVGLGVGVARRVVACQGSGEGLGINEKGRGRHRGARQHVATPVETTETSEARLWAFQNTTYLLSGPINAMLRIHAKA